MFAMLSSCEEIESSGCPAAGADADADAGAGAGAGVGVDELVMLVRGGSRICAGIVIVCSAFMVAEGGVFSPRRALWLGRAVGVWVKSKAVEGDVLPNCANLRSDSLPK